MTITKYIISKYIATFVPENFEPKNKMAYENSEFDSNFIFEEFNNKEDALAKMNETYTDSVFRTVSSFDGELEFSVTDIVLNKITYDEDDNIINIEFIKSSEITKDFLNEYKYQIIEIFGDLVDFERESEENNNVKLIFKVNDKFYITKDYVEIPFLKSYKNNSNYNHSYFNNDFTFLQDTINSYDYLENAKFEDYKMSLKI